MKIAIDVDGVITEAPDFFSALTKSLKAAGHSVFIVTDFDEHFRKDREKELDEYGIAYDELVITADKEQFCRENRIDYALDDDVEYFPGAVSNTSLNLFTLKMNR